ncbi:MAG: hypothetical protein PHW24_03920, partial [Candidatus Moranbacteria bacterium]|nr:hypothetical protein [Candidatus Moranbacteria bacterium]
YAMPVVLAGGVMGKVIQGKGKQDTSVKPSCTLINRVNCLHAGSNTQPKHSAFHTRDLVESEFAKCKNECGYACQQ